MNRRSFVRGALAAPSAAMPLSAQAEYQKKTRGLPPLKITDVKVITTSASRGYQWVIVKVLTNEPGLYGLGSASNVNLAWGVVSAIEKHYAPFWIGRDPDRIEDLWQSTNVRGYWRNSTIHNNALSGLDMALWDIKGKRAGMPVHDLLGGKAREAVPCYAHADGRDSQQVEDNIRKFVEQGYRHVRAQLGGYGGGGFIPAGQGSRPATGYQGPAMDEDYYLHAVPKMFEQLRAKLGWDVKLLHDVHERISPTKAVEFAKRMEQYHLFFLEDALSPEQIAWFRNIRQVCSTPLAMGETFTSPLEYMPLVSERLIDFVRNRVSQTGGITQAKKTAAVCEAFGVRTAFQEGGDNDPINQLASYHVDMSISSFGIQEDNRFPEQVHEMMPGAAQIKGGYMYGSGSPGLGIDLNEDLAKKYPMQVLPGQPHWTEVRGMDGSVVKP